MDEATLLEHREVWGSEPQPSAAALTRLTGEESALYQALRVNGTFGPAVRLEQELIRWDWAQAQACGWSEHSSPLRLSVRTTRSHAHERPDRLFCGAARH